MKTRSQLTLAFFLTCRLALAHGIVTEDGRARWIKAGATAEWYDRAVAAQGKVDALDPPLDRLESSVTALEEESKAGVADKAAFAAKVGLAADQGAAAWEKYKTLSLTIDALGTPVNTPTRDLRGQANFLGQRLGKCLGGLQALQKTHGIILSVAPAGAAKEEDPAVASLREKHAPSFIKLPGNPFEELRGPGNQNPGLAPAKPAVNQPIPKLDLAGPTAKSLLPAPPAPSRPDPAVIAASKPPYLGFIPRSAGCGGKSENAQNSAKSFKDEAQQTAAFASMNAEGKSETMGDPKGRASLVHRQSGGTCSIVAQQQLLLAYGKIPKNADPKKQEEQLFLEASQKGYFKGTRDSGGTPWEFIGNLLQDHGLIVAKHARATDGELVAAVAAGKIILADVDTSRFWYNRAFKDSTHSVIVTGLERAKESNTVLGFYVNDSDGGVYHSGGRLVPTAVFLAAWHARESRFVEVQ